MSLPSTLKRKTQLFACVMYGMWGCLGGYRGHQDYEKRKKLSYSTKYSYIDAFLESLVGGISYTLPCSNILYAYKEIKLLEKKMRNIDDEDF